ncbi:MAG: SDR family NAD(P)-dependent oxidoreductase [Bacteroidales bacterium]|nr:SDR family NAD(P)-dependent oxidoreductase [Bacteroidales bacterium]
MNPINEKYALVTGSGSGIGKAIAKELALRGIRVLLVALPGEDLAGYAEDLSRDFGIKTDALETDLSLPGGPGKVIEWVKKNQYPVYFLVNNAGMAGTAVFEQSDDKYIDDRILVNIRALTFLCRYFIPELKKHEKSYILNVSSLSAYYAIPFKALYSSTKAFVLNFSRAIRTELKESPISVSALCPNGVQTNEGTFSRIAAHGKKGKYTTVPVEKVARMAVDHTLREKFLIIPGRVNHFLVFLSRLLPHAVEQNILYREFLKEVSK